MTSQREAFEKWWDKASFIKEKKLNDRFLARASAIEAWQAAQADQAERVKELENKIDIINGTRNNLRIVIHTMEENAQLQLENKKLREALEEITKISEDTPIWHSERSSFRIKPQPKEKKYLYIYKDKLGKTSITTDYFCPNEWVLFGKIEVQDD